MDNVTSPQRPEEQKEILATRGSTSETGGVSADSGVREHVATTVETAVGANEVLAGMEGNEVKESAGEVIAEDRQTKQTRQSGQQQSQSQGQSAIHAQLAQQKVVPQKVMVRKVKTAISTEIKKAKKEIKRFKRNALKFAHELAEAFQHLRNLRNLLRDIASFAIEFIQMLYQKVMKKQSLATVEY